MQLKNWSKNSPKELIDHVKTKKKTDTCFIMGGGPSLLPTINNDPSILEGKDVIVANNAYKLFPDALLLHFMDKVWYQWHTKPKHDLHNNFNNPITTSSLANKYDNVNAIQFKRITCNTSSGLSNHTNFLDGNNTGHQCINIAYHLGFKNVVLLGYDLNIVKNTNWHSDHERATNTAHYETMIHGFNKLSKTIESIDLNVYNTNMNSALRCFEFKSIEEFL